MVSPENVIWSPSAQKDLENITDYLMYHWSSEVVENFLNRLTRLIQQIEINPGQYPVIHLKLKVRKCVVTKQNTLYYRKKNNHIEILRIFDTRQNLEKLKILF